jgi:predicted tellurium resistance membrane protein TerC
MIFLSEPLSQLISHYPTIKMLALSFLILIGTLLVADGLHFHVPREYIYFAICFSIFVEILNTIAKRKR